MRYVLDTCSFIWLVSEQSKLSEAALTALDQPSTLLHVSAISLTEIHRLVRKGKLTLHVASSLDVWFEKGLNHHGIYCEPISWRIAHAAEVLPAIHHDPADRFIIATAQTIGAEIVTPDALISQYPGVGIVW